MLDTLSLEWTGMDSSQTYVIQESETLFLGLLVLKR